MTVKGRVGDDKLEQNGLTNDLNTLKSCTVLFVSSG